MLARLLLLALLAASAPAQSSTALFKQVDDMVAGLSEDHRVADPQKSSLRDAQQRTNSHRIVETSI